MVEGWRTLTFYDISAPKFRWVLHFSVTECYPPKSVVMKLAGGCWMNPRLSSNKVHISASFQIYRASSVNKSALRNSELSWCALLLSEEPGLHDDMPCPNVQASLGHPEDTSKKWHRERIMRHKRFISCLLFLCLTWKFPMWHFILHSTHPFSLPQHHS